MSRRVVLVLVAVLFIMSIPFVSAGAHPINLEIGPKTTMPSPSYVLEKGDVFGVSVSISGYIDIQIEYGRGQDVMTWRNVTGDFMGNMTIKRDNSYYIDFYNLDSDWIVSVIGYIVINDFVIINTTTSSTTTFPFNTTTTTNGDWLQDWSWLISPLMLATAVCIIIIIGYVCRGREEDLHFLLNIEEALFGLPEKETED